MIDAYAVYHPLAGELEKQAVRGIEHRVVLHPQGGQRVDVEETSVIDIVRGHPPEG